LKLRNSSLSFFCMLAAVIIMPQPLTAQSGAYIAPRTAYGQPDLQGTFTFRTLTPMQRPADFADQGVLNADQAEVWTVNESMTASAEPAMPLV
jgi:hydroxyacyl-ACP dehydratase HTD2-like protein with hotdog domain